MRIQNFLVFHLVCLVEMMKKWEGKCKLLLCPYWIFKQWDSKGDLKFHVYGHFLTYFLAYLEKKNDKLGGKSPHLTIFLPLFLSNQVGENLIFFFIFILPFSTLPIFTPIKHNFTKNILFLFYNLIVDGKRI